MGHSSRAADQPCAGRAHGTPTARGPLRVLLVEDNRVNQKLAVRVLEKRGHRVTAADNGQVALDLLDADPAAFDIILMDVQMPVLDGYEATRAIRRREQEQGTRHVPIIAMTANAMKGDRELCLSAGMDDYISKPLQPNDLYRIVDAWGALRENATASGSATETPAPADTRTGTEEPVTAHSADVPGPATATAVVACPPIDMDDLMARLDGDRELVDEVLASFQEVAPTLLQSIIDAAAAGDAAALRAAAHSLKGSTGNISAKQAYEQLLRLEELAKSGSLEHVGAVVDGVRRQVNELLAYLPALPAESATTLASH